MNNFWNYSNVNTEEKATGILAVGKSFRAGGFQIIIGCFKTGFFRNVGQIDLVSLYSLVFCSSTTSILLFYLDKME